MQDSLRDVQQAIALQPSHISFYQLTLEPNTYFHKYPPALPGDEAIFDEQLACQELLAEHGYQQYEISESAVAAWRLANGPAAAPKINSVCRRP
jgi:oxygen-independent coproporphyrinogen-3 oxidase